MPKAKGKPQPEEESEDMSEEHAGLLAEDETQESEALFWDSE